MTLSVILDVVIALVFTYFLLALIASGVQELISAVFAWRGTYLSKGIDVIMDNSSAATFNWGGICGFLSAHFTPGPAPTSANRLDASIATNPGGVAQPAQAVLKRVLDVQTHPLMRSAPTNLPSYISARNFSTALLDTLRDGSKSPLFSQAERTVAALPAGDLKKTLSAFLESAGGDLDAFRAHLEQWFDDAMDRLSGIYRRLSQYTMIILGVLLAVGLNVDSVHLARTLWQTPALRAELVANATAAIAQPPPKPDGGKGVADAQAALLQGMQTFEAQQIPFGWPVSDFSIFTIGGWAITAGAISLGAPFWFSLLQSLSNMRSAGPKPKRSDDPSGPGT